MRRLLHRISNWYLSRAALPYWTVVMMDSGIVLFSGFVGMYFQIGGSEFARWFWQIFGVLVAAVLVSFVFFRVFETYRGIIRFSSFVDLLKICVANFLSFTVFGILSKAVQYFYGDLPYVPDLLCLFVMLFCSSLAMCFVRIIVKTLLDMFRFGSDDSRRAFIYGAKSAAVAIAKGLKSQESAKLVLAGFVDTDGSSTGRNLMGCRVYQDDDNLPRVMHASNAKILIVSPLQIQKFRERQKLISDLTAAGIRIFMLPEVEEWNENTEINHNQLKEVEVEDLLPRAKIEVDMKAVASHLKNKKILITGAAGSIGSEIVRQVASFHPEEMVLIDQAETPMHDIRMMMADSFPYIKASTIVASITNEECMEKIFAGSRPDYVFHAAAYKHVPMMEDNPSMAVQNNVRGTKVIADMSVKYGVRKFVMISTDKAVNPTNVMGCSKRICEIYCQSLNREIQKFVESGAESLPADSLLGRLNPCPRTQFVTTRFGNVLGSNGSVIPIFREQIKHGGPVTVTDPEIIRFFMLIPEACKLVLEACSIGRGGEILVFDMGMPVKIADLAQRMIDLSGAKNVKIAYTGLRDGEKLYEEVLSDKENVLPTSNPKIMIAKVREYEYAEALANEDALYDLSRTADAMEIVRMMKKIVPEYKSRNSVYCSLD